MNTSRVATVRSRVMYATLTALGLSAFVYPFFLPSIALADRAHSGDAPLWSAVIGVAVVVIFAIELQQRTMNSATVAVLGVLAAMCALMRLLDLPGGGSGIFFLVILAGAAFGARFGLLLGLTSMALSAILVGGLGPWLPFQMLALGWVGAASGMIGARLDLERRSAIVVLAVFGWLASFAYGALMNLWFWPFQQDGGALSWSPDLGFAQTVTHYVRFYMTTSFAWDAAGAFANAVLIVATGAAVLHVLSRVVPRLSPVAVVS
jgi:energy-coupling factor transport system substrate-specific component